MSPTVRSVVVFLFASCALVAAAAWQNGEKTEPADGLLPVLRPSGAFWKGNLHTHSLWSDGDDFPEMIADWYKRHGYHFLALSDHNTLSDGVRWIDAARPEKSGALQKYLARFGESWVERRTEKDKKQVRLKPLAEFRSLLESPGRFLMIPAEEVTHRFAKLPVHMNAINLRDVVKPVDGASVEETIRANHRAIADQVKRTGWSTLIALNHPNFGWGVRAEDMAPIDELRFFEVFNGHPGVRNYGDEQHASCERMWDIVLALRLGKHKLPVVYGTATDDAHAYHAYGPGKVNPGRGWVMVRAPHLSAEALVRALGAGDFHISTGVVLRDVRRDKDRLAVSIQAEEGVKYKTEFIATLVDAPLHSEVRFDSKKQPLDVTRTYSAEIGKVVATVTGAEAEYRFAGTERYVRAKVTSTKPHPNPYQKGDIEVAWTQPVIP